MLGRDSTPFLRERGLTILRSIFGLLPRAVVSLPSLVFSTFGNLGSTSHIVVIWFFCLAIQSWDATALFHKG